MSFSLVEKLALTGAFLGIVAMAVGTDEDPGLVAEQAEVLAARAKERAHEPLPAREAPPAEAGPAPATPDTPPAADVNEGSAVTAASPDTQSSVLAQPARQVSPPDDEATQLDMRKVIAGQK